MEKKILQVTCYDSLSLEDFKQAFVTVTQSSEYPPDVATMWDCRTLDFNNIERGFEEQLIALREGHPERGDAKIAIVASDELAYGLSRMYEIKASTLAQQMMVFREVDEAEAWLLDDG